MSTMKSVNVTNARASLYSLIDDVSETHEPLYIRGKRNNAVLVSEDDWRSIQETLYLSSIPGIKEAIFEARKEPIKECSTELKW